ncbi:uncharacterized protein PG986_014218 [Apiospora aurea]|uniref:Uncharacterized protein n=1 Tax=Apiospora aurea TaxID=335848 RepID=A0ABR1PSC6_9PEZI
MAGDELDEIVVEGRQNELHDQLKEAHALNQDQEGIEAADYEELSQKAARHYNKVLTAGQMDS